MYVEEAYVSRLLAVNRGQPPWSDLDQRPSATLGEDDGEEPGGPRDAGAAVVRHGVRDAGEG